MVGRGRFEMDIGTVLAQKGPNAYKVVSVTPSVSLLELANRLSINRLGAVPVIDSANRLVGIVSERDIVDSFAMHGARALEMTVSQLMTHTVKVITARTTLAEAMEAMMSHHLRHLPVVEEGVVAAMISINDVVFHHVLARNVERDWKGEEIR